MREDMHPRGIHPNEERLIGFRLPRHEVDSGGCGFVVDSLHPLSVEWAGVFDGLFADATPVRLLGWIVPVGGTSTQYASWRVGAGVRLVTFGPLRPFRLFLGVQVIKVAEELIEAVHRGQEFVAVAQVVLAKLAGGVA